MGGNTSLHQWGSFCQKQLSHQEDPRNIAKLDSSRREVTGHKISSDLMLFTEQTRKHMWRIHERACVRVPQPLGSGSRGRFCWLPSWKYFLRVCYTETSGKTRVSRTHGGGKVDSMCFLYPVCLSSWFNFILWVSIIAKPSVFCFSSLFILKV